MDTPYVLRKNGMWYGHNSCGYVSRVEMAELYTEEYAKRHAAHCDDIQAIPVIDMLPSPEHVQQFIDRLEVMKEAAEAIKAE